MLKYKDSENCVNDLLHKNNIKLIAIDIDGTLSDDTGKISDENLNAIQVAKKLGINVIFATGKLRSNALKLFTQKQKEIYKVHTIDGIFSNGAYLNIKGYDYVYRNFKIMDLEFILLALSTYNILKNAVFLTVDFAYVFNDSPNKQEDIYKNELEGFRSSVKYVNIIDKSYNAVLLSTIKDIFLIGDIVSVEIYTKLYPHQEPFNELFSVLYKELEGHFKIYTPLNKDKIVLSPLNTAKVHAAHLYSQFYDIHISDVLSIGNDNNDVDLLAATGYSVAVKNSTTPAMNVAKCVSTKTNSENAVANIIYKVITGRRM
ncbi:haloacid dehalogenase-like hydrolase [Plasmodium brasilianum]|uniref:Haloacid dehalogenase-like hydrolase, putative n=2 Tax=Plasmodium (Plasmodium) TaxID=418103 RepID=A0A1A8X5J7_PLAMA|nr:haloacid dehalogenase-like hydrolase, putative [Plasmodium malariae]KAI4834972.1 haloacid dehalogenase-like hydrolase [Plasmodium brasilianum]SBS99874.1 haloacid dehalogenase-like hydrolase, putative (HAD3) [Plasmodium malariae]SCP03544.1 haloacid dehalogenase-like hydrolase, putative [Plasmodium malariae]